MGVREEHARHLRLRMAEKGLFETSDLVPLLAERGIHLSREQVYRLPPRLAPSPWPPCGWSTAQFPELRSVTKHRTLARDTAPSE